MSELNTVSLSDWATPAQIAEENPAMPVATIRYLIRSRDRLNFGSCVRFMGPKRVLIRRARLAEWIESQQIGGNNREERATK